MRTRWLILLITALALLGAACGADVEITSGAATDGADSTDDPEGPDGADDGSADSDGAGVDGGAADDDGSDDGESDDGSDDDSAGDDGAGDDSADDSGGEVSAQAVSAAERLGANIVGGGAVLADAETDCLARGLATDDELLEFAQSGVPPTTLAPAQTDRLVVLVTDCLSAETVAASFIEGFAAGAGSGFEVDPGQEACLADALAAPDARRAIVELAVAAEGLSMAPGDAQFLAELLAQCLDGGFVGTLMVEGVLGELTGTGISPEDIDEACLASVMQGDLLVAYYSSVLQGQQFDDLPLDVRTEFITGFVGCLDLASAFQTAFEQEGVIISESSATCVADLMIDSGLFERLVSGDTPTDAEVGALLVGCLTPDELAQFDN
ncbi:MAG: hypothetical protein KDB21_15825 [Acidimicrobiales bacterium]|nr:hypothetical protein [Acidimicrobiales bacterium]